MPISGGSLFIVARRPKKRWHVSQFKPSMKWVQARRREADERLFERAPKESPKPPSGRGAPPKPMPTKPMSPFIAPPPGEEQFADDMLDPMGGMFLGPPLTPGMNGPPMMPGGPGDGGLGRSPVMQRQRQPSGGPSQRAPQQKSNPLMHSPSGPGPTKSPGGSGKSPGGKPPATGPGGHSPGGAPAVGFRAALRYLADDGSNWGGHPYLDPDWSSAAIADMPGLPSAAPPEMGAPPAAPPGAPPQAPQAPAMPSAAPPSPGGPPGSPGVQAGHRADDGWGGHPYLDPDWSSAKRRGFMFARLRLR